MEYLTSKTQEILEKATIKPLPEGSRTYSHMFKIIVIGNAGVGKSCLTIKAIKNTFSITQTETVGFDFYNYYVQIDENIINLQIWDTSGTEAYKSLVSNFYRNASLAVLVYAINERQSYIDLSHWLKEIKNQSNPDVKIILIGNKIDLENQREVGEHEAHKFAKDQDFSFFYEASAKTGFNADKIFIDAAKILYGEYLDYKNADGNKINFDDEIKTKKGNKLIPKPPTKGFKTGCCKK